MVERCLLLALHCRAQRMRYCLRPPHISLLTTRQQSGCSSVSSFGFVPIVVFVPLIHSTAYMNYNVNAGAMGEPNQGFDLLCQLSFQIDFLCLQCKFLFESTCLNRSRMLLDWCRSSISSTMPVASGNLITRFIRMDVLLCCSECMPISCTLHCEQHSDESRAFKTDAFRECFCVFMKLHRYGPSMFRGVWMRRGSKPRAEMRRESLAHDMSEWLLWSGSVCRGDVCVPRGLDWHGL